MPMKTSTTQEMVITNISLEVLCTSCKNHKKRSSANLDLSAQTILRRFELDELFSKQILSRKTMPRMNGAFLLLFTTDQLGSGSVEVTLESDMTEKDAEIQHFSGRGSEKVKEQGYDCLIEDGMMKKTGSSSLKNLV